MKTWKEIVSKEERIKLTAEMIKAKISSEAATLELKEDSIEVKPRKYNSIFMLGQICDVANRANLLCYATTYNNEIIVYIHGFED